MTDQELDTLMRRVLLDSLKLDAESAASGELAFEPTPRYQRQMAAMVKDPLKWERRRARPLWKNVAQKAAVILLVFSLSLGSLMAVSPTVRAAVVRWVTEWYEPMWCIDFRENSFPEKCHSMRSRIYRRAMLRM